ncbi:MAG: DNA replication/repair protein RecF, partial [Nostocoides sp.]
MFVRHLSVTDFRSYAEADVPLEPGVSTLVGLNGQGKTNLIEALGYLSTLGSHRVATDAPLVRAGAERAVIQAAVIRDDRETRIDVEIVPGRANKARVNKSPVSRPRDILGVLRTVLFAPEDLALVKGDPRERRRFLDDLLVARQPKWAAVRGEYDRIIKQRNALLKSARPMLATRDRRARRSPALAPEESTTAARASAVATLEVWDGQLAGCGAQLLYARLRLLRDLRPHLAQAYHEVSAGVDEAAAIYRASLTEDVAAAIADGHVPEPADLEAAIADTLAQRHTEEVERGVTLVGPHRDEVSLTLGALPAKGYASHGESWSLALGLRLGAFHLLRRDLGTDPVLILDDVFAELDTQRRERLAALVADAEQVLVTAAVPQDVPEALTGRTYAVTLGEI